MKKRVLECSSIGDIRFSAFYAEVEVYNKLGSIEEHYQSVKCKFDDKKVGVRCKKGEYVDYIVIGDEVLHPRFLTPYYKLLWIKYFDKNPELLYYAQEFDEFRDIFKGRSINCQADVIRKLVRDGRGSLMAECEELLAKLRKK